MSRSSLLVPAEDHGWRHGRKWLLAGGHIICWRGMQTKVVWPAGIAEIVHSIGEHNSCTIEAMKHAYSLRMSLSDPAFFSNITEAAVDDMMHGNYMENLRRITKDDGILDMVNYGGCKWGILENEDVEAGQVEMTEEGHDNRRRRLLRGEGHEDSFEEHVHQHGRNLKDFQYLNDHGTTHFAIIDKEGNTVTMTTTINTYFGSGIVSPSTGIIFNSQVSQVSLLFFFRAADLSRD